ncbi:heterokaryon incompatibility protein-domain-containing protein [Podospora fimiseda]|uniref:Heterokaryon incompatibility protein-domain-containing protein n=1 Tax=Podospora fimiseda TaxID=252190 RepID=A0AAN6YNX3_9PEZI|nr:heterokaryon incompatibility protein-domain-containing protein [Podospora fimiseda]
MSPPTTLIIQESLSWGSFILERLQQSTAKQLDLCRTITNEYCQRQCNGCDKISELLRWAGARQRQDPCFEGCSESYLVHNNYLELDHCANTSRCETCRTIRRAFLLEQITGQDVARLENNDNTWPVHVVLNLRPSGDSLLFTCGPPNETPFSATVALDRTPHQYCHELTRCGARRCTDFAELKKVIGDCHQNHECSSRYRWSHRNPTWLIEIGDDDHVRLVRGPPSLVQYVVLSYSWGDPAEMPAEEWARIKGAGTKTKNGKPVPERLNPFKVWELPETMRDAISIAKTLGFSYIWIDNVCIPKGTNWDTEAGLMHEVYGNAAFTLVASSSTKATDNMLRFREAWNHRSKAVKLRGQWLHNTQMPLDKVRVESPVARRAWTLQEERLSPRVLYWTSQRWFWSCPEKQLAELSQLGHRVPPAENEQRRSPQLFLELCRTGDGDQLHEEWLDIVEAYTPRDLVEPKDRFLAIAGLAVRFYNSKAEAGGSFITEEYLAGLWRDNFARHLSWSVTTASNFKHSLQHIAPSWSWASLPLRVDTKTKHDFKLSKHFKFISVVHEEEDPVVAATSLTRTGSKGINRARAAEERGRGVKVVEVEGRFRRFVADEAIGVEWNSIEWARGDRIGFNFSAFPGKHLCSRNKLDGRIISKDAHSGEIVGQLDYLTPGENGQPESLFNTPFVSYGNEKEIMCLELGELAMLLLVRNHNSVHGQEEESYRRVGVAIGYSNRKGFFYGCETKRIRLA